MFNIRHSRWHFAQVQKATVPRRNVPLHTSTQCPVNVTARDDFTSLLPCYNVLQATNAGVRGLGRRLSGCQGSFSLQGLHHLNLTLVTPLTVFVSSSSLVDFLSFLLNRHISVSSAGYNEWGRGLHERKGEREDSVHVDMMEYREAVE